MQLSTAVASRRRQRPLAHCQQVCRTGKTSSGMGYEQHKHHAENRASIPAAAGKCRVKLKANWITRAAVVQGLSIARQLARGGHGMPGRLRRPAGYLPRRRLLPRMLPLRLLLLLPLLLRLLLQLLLLLLPSLLPAHQPSLA